MGIVLDIVMIVLLGFTIGFCWRLNKRISELRESRKELTDLIYSFDTAVVNTHKSITHLKEASTNTSIEMKGYIAKSEELINEMSFMNDSASKLADRLELAINLARNTHELLNHALRDVAIKELKQYSNATEIKAANKKVSNTKLKKK